MKDLCIVVLLILFFIGCNKENSEIADYRDEFIGKYEFITYEETKEFLSHSDTVIVFCDTVLFNGFIQKYEKDKLEITFQDHGTEPILDSLNFIPKRLGKIYPTVSVNGELYYPIFSKYGDGVSFNGRFEKNSIINFMYGYEVHEFTSVYKVVGIKKNSYD